MQNASTETGALTIDLSALKRNYTRLNLHSGRAECSAVVKADAYGTGADQVSAALYEAGCRTFFVATFQEGEFLRKCLPDTAVIYCLNGLHLGSAEKFANLNLRPVLGSIDEIKDWTSTVRDPAALHFDTGMNRLGLTPEEFLLLHDSTLLKDWQPSLIMSHLACGDEPAHPRNGLQLKRFMAMCSAFPGVPTSIANSAGILLGKDFHLDMVRPGIYLYGSWPLEVPHALLPSLPLNEPVVHLGIRIIKVKTLPKGESIGYGATHFCERDTRLATLCIGYADGYLRSAGNHATKPMVYINGIACPVVGRVSMDLITVDITDVEGEVKTGDHAEILGSKASLDELAKTAGTIGYEFLTSLGHRYPRQYLNAKKDG